MPLTLCWHCKNAVPDERGHGCPWSESFVPVPGWTADFAPLYHSGGAGKYLIDSYHVVACPLYLREAGECEEAEQP